MTKIEEVLKKARWRSKHRKELKEERKRRCRSFSRTI
jgi:hypothetical protein